VLNAKTDTIPMILVPGGVAEIGSNDGLPAEQPIFTVTIDSFYMDAWPVTVADFRLFINATAYKTDADQYGDAGVLNYSTGEWSLVKDANWLFPFGPDSPQAIDNHPVTQVSLRDARAYAAWAGKKLPTEIEWEYAAESAAKHQSPYPFDGEPYDSTGWKINIWQGDFPYKNVVEDGFAYTCPVNQFQPNVLGLYGMVGNVWQWTDSPVSEYPIGMSWTDTTQYVQRGGSFLCESRVCHGYRTSSRSFCEPNTSLFHVGFRCVRHVGKSAKPTE
jgi:formylglycine-generating enzyme